MHVYENLSRIQLGTDIACVSVTPWLSDSTGTSPSLVRTNRPEHLVERQNTLI